MAAAQTPNAPATMTIEEIRRLLREKDIQGYNPVILQYLQAMYVGSRQNVSHAMMAKNGGIDFDTRDAEFTSNGLIDPTMMNQILNINPADVIGVTIGNITITPIPSVRALLGLNDPQEDDSVPSKPYFKDLAFNRKKNV